MNATRTASGGLRRARLPLILLLVLICGPGAPRAFGQASWEYSPYDIRVWIAYGTSPELTEFMRADLEQAIIDQSWITAGATWKVQPAAAPESIDSTILYALDAISIEQVETVAGDAFEADKILLLAIEADRGRYHLAAREVDCRSRVLGRVVRNEVQQRDLLGAEVMTTLTQAFSPLVRIEESKGNEATIRVRAGGLVTSESSPSHIGVNSILQPVIRRNDRYGKPSSIEVVEWTYLRVDRPNANLWECELATALRNPLAGRGSARTLLFGLGVTPTGSKTQLRLVSLETRRVEGENLTVEVPLEGYEIFAKSPLPPAEGERAPIDRIGRTDWRGIIEIERTPEYPMRLIYVKNGNFLLAKLPTIPGLESVTTADLTSDDRRLEVEAFVKGMESTVMDVVARRNILAARIRRYLDAGKLDKAKEMLEEFAQIPDIADLQRTISNRRASVSSNNPREQKRIAALLSGVEGLLQKFLDNDMQGDLRQALRDAGVDPTPSAEPEAG